METQQIIDGLLAAVGAVIGFVVYLFHGRISDLEDDNSEAPRIYVRRDDYQHATDRLFKILERIEDKLDRKADK